MERSQTTDSNFGPFLTSAAAFNNPASGAPSLGIQNVQDVFKTFNLSGNQTSVTISFTFNEIDSWDGENFLVWVNDVQVSANAFAQGSGQNYANTTSDNGGGVNIGFGGWTDELHTYVLTVNTTATTVKLVLARVSIKTGLMKDGVLINLVIRENLANTNQTYTEGNSGNDSISGLVSFWKADGSSANDTVGANNGTLINGATISSSGRSGAAFQLDGVDDYVGVGTTSSLAVTNQFTVDAWVNPSGNGSGNSGVIAGREGQYLLRAM